MDRYSHWRFPHEDLDVYQNARELLRCVHALCWPRRFGDLKSQLTRAALSVSLNICEGRAQRLAGNTGTNFYRIALGSAAECHGALEALEIVTNRAFTAEIALVHKVGAQLTGLVRAAT
ncbi:MAG: four helix bundle protein [Planctomycetota bacterium]